MINFFALVAIKSVSNLTESYIRKKVDEVVSPYTIRNDDDRDTKRYLTREEKVVLQDVAKTNNFILLQKHMYECFGKEGYYDFDEGLYFYENSSGRFVDDYSISGAFDGEIFGATITNYDSYNTLERNVISANHLPIGEISPPEGIFVHKDYSKDSHEWRRLPTKPEVLNTLKQNPNDKMWQVRLRYFDYMIKSLFDSLLVGITISCNRIIGTYNNYG